MAMTMSEEQPIKELVDELSDMLGPDTDFDNYTFSIQRGRLRRLLAALATPQPAEARGMVEAAAEAILHEARVNGSDSPVDYGDAERLAKAALSTTLSPQAGGGKDEPLMVPRYATDRMMEAGLYHMPDGVEWSDLFTAWQAMFDCIAMDGGCTDELPASPPAPADNAGLVEALRQIRNTNGGNMLERNRSMKRIAEAALRANGAEQTGWQDIASAPKDGTHFLAYERNGNAYRAAWHDGLQCWMAFVALSAAKFVKPDMWRPWAEIAPVTEEPHP